MSLFTIFLGFGTLKWVRHTTSFNERFSTFQFTLIESTNTKKVIRDTKCCVCGDWMAVYILYLWWILVERKRKLRLC